MHAEHVDVLDLEARSLDLAHDPAERARRVRAGEDVLVNEQAPDEVLVLPVGTDTSDLEDEDAVVVEEVVHLAEESGVATDTNVLGHLERDDLGVRGAATGNVAVVEAEDACARSITTVGRNAVVAELGLVLAEGDTGDLAAVVLVRERGKGAPTATNIQKTVLGLQVEL